MSDDRGQILLLTTGFVALALLLVLVTVDVTALHLQRQELHALTDAAARDAADAMDKETFYERGAQGRPVPLSDASVYTSVRDYLAQRADVADVAVGAPTGALGESTAQVTLTGTARIPLIGLVVRRWAGGVPLKVTSQATAEQLP